MGKAVVWDINGEIVSIFDTPQEAEDWIQFAECELLSTVYSEDGETNIIILE